MNFIIKVIEFYYNILAQIFVSKEKKRCRRLIVVRLDLPTKDSCNDLHRSLTSVLEKGYPKALKKVLIDHKIKEDDYE